MRRYRVLVRGEKLDALIETLDRHFFLEGRILCYGQVGDPQGTVTFASVAFEAPTP